MILVDDRDGSNELIPLLPDCVPCRLTSGDVAIPGNGPEGEVLVGVEVKKVRDLLQSMETGRLAATQLPQLLVDYNHVWLLIVGEYREGRGGRLEVKGSHGRWWTHRIGSREVPCGYVEGFLVELSTVGVNIKQVHDNGAAASWISLLARWWDRDWASHKALKKFDRSAAAKVAGMPMDERDAEWRRRDQIARAAATLPGIGWDRAQEIARTFPSIRYMSNAEIEEWVEIKGIGKVLARTAVEAINGE